MAELRVLFQNNATGSHMVKLHDPLSDVKWVVIGGGDDAGLSLMRDVCSPWLRTLGQRSFPNPTSDVPRTKTHQNPVSLVALQGQGRAKLEHRVLADRVVRSQKRRISLCEPPHIANRAS